MAKRRFPEKKRPILSFGQATLPITQDTKPTVTENMLTTADGDGDNELSMINSAKRRESDETYDDYDEGERDTPDDHSTRIAMPEPTRRDRKSCFVPYSDLWKRMTKVAPYLPIRKQSLFLAPLPARRRIMLPWKRRGMMRVFGLWRRWHYPSNCEAKKGRVGTATSTRIMSRTRMRMIMKSQKLRRSITTITTIVTMTTIKVEATAATLMMTIGKITTTGKKAV
jgi:hypothetical protein